MVVSKKLEPYPAVILPDGSSKAVYDDEYITYSKIKLIGQDATDGTYRNINSDLFFAPIPSNRIYGFVNNGFGISAVRNDTFRFRKSLFNAIVTSKEYRESDNIELVNWYQTKLNAQGLNENEFAVVEEVVTIDRSTSEIIDSVESRRVNYTLND